MTVDFSTTLLQHALVSLLPGFVAIPLGGGLIQQGLASLDMAQMWMGFIVVGVVALLIDLLLGIAQITLPRTRAIPLEGS